MAADPENVELEARVDELLMGVDLVELQERIDQLLERLAQEERQIIELWHGLLDGYTYTPEEIGRINGMTPERVREIEAEATRKIRETPPL